MDIIRKLFNDTFYPFYHSSTTVASSKQHHHLGHDYKPQRQTIKRLSRIIEDEEDELSRDGVRIRIYINCI